MGIPNFGSSGRFTSRCPTNRPYAIHDRCKLADMNPELRQKGIDCQTCHKLMRNTEDSRIKIPDGEIAEFARHAGRSLTLIVMDHDLAEHCKFGKLPHIRVQDAVAEYILRNPAH